MNRIKTIIVLILVTCFSMPLFSQNTSTQGKEFWLAFMHNGYKDHILGGWITTQVLISAKRDCTGTVTNPLTGWETEFSVRANNITTVEIPEAQGYHNGTNNETVSNCGIRIMANDTISVYCTNIAYVSFDASFALPVESLGDDYIIQCYDQSRTGSNDYVSSNETSAFLIVATEDDTEIDITPTVNTLGGHTAGETFSVTLNAGQTYQVRSTRSSIQRDLSGTRVTASDCKKIAVFNGNTLTSIPTSMDNGYDHIFEQAMPLRSWGKKFVVTNSLNRNRDFIKITSSADNNTITKNGQALTTLNAYESYVFSVMESEQSCFIQADQPCAVYLYNNSSYDQNIGGGLGDPSMVWIAPVEQRIDDVTFTTFNNGNINITNHSVNIIVSSDDIGNVYLDEQLISPQLFSHVAGNDDYSFTRRNISHGVHHIVCENGFNAHVYGFGDAKGYAYLVGSNAIDLSTNLIVNNENVHANSTYQYCDGHPITFFAEVNYQNYNLHWDFGDGTTSTDNPATHTYAEKRIFLASLIVDAEAVGCNLSDSDTTHFIIDATQQYIIESDNICVGERYTGYGFNNVLINNDTILARLEDNSIHSECQDSLLVYITAHQTYHVPISDSRCWQEGGSVYDGYGFSFEYNDPGIYERTRELQTAQGCDSIVTLTLTVSDRITHEFNTHECSGTYVWDGRPYTQSGDYEWVYTTQAGCDSIVTLHLTIGSIQHSEFDTILCGPFMWEGVEYSVSGDYDHIYNAIDGCDSIVTCHLNVSGNVEGTTETISECDNYEWYGTSYTQTGFYSHVLTTPMGCDSTIYLNLHIDYSPDPTPIYPVDTNNQAPHWVITATEFQINNYDFHLWDNNPICRWDTVVWDFDREIDWLIDPYGDKGKHCKIYVLSQEEDTVWLQAHVYSICNQTNGTTQRYWILSSFYGIEDQENTASFEVAPNPNNGTMSLHFSHLEGRSDIKVYDMRGVMIDNLQVINDNDEITIPYDMSGKADGIYFFIATNKEGTIAKKVIIRQ